MSFLCYHGGVRWNKGMWGNREIGVVIYGRIRGGIYVLLIIHLPLPLV